ncbi:hypothetical protein BCL57_001949 [Agromyces flavus]|uniref:Uncharacterized protein n=1 Tax=Agromyces flavus TaxID=589382 RepID=A0A1H1Q795_9MICO|nr:hypothetical protein [Agromyces flavus]MCP2367790.1 hypothetical protein [Agromyces flavus]GGI47250.1 hypothetical protein GCM10010932_19380 [Agromyces flavus]SDS19295.1 hypothetical protein SAMN04489721_0916 [Agromyces flavus]
MSYPLYPADPNRDPAEPFRNLEPAPTTATTAVIDPAPRQWDDPIDERPITVEEVAERQREAFGGPKIGSAFFGWLTATATGAILAGVVVVVTAVIGLDVIPDPWATGGLGPFDGVTVGWIVIGIILAIVLVSFYCGGYVAGRMARFSGAAQGLAVWGWAVVIGIAAAVAIGLLDGRFGFVAAGRDAVPSIPVSVELVTVAWIGAAVALVLVSIGGAVLGGTVGVRYHRRVDRVGLEA